MDPFSTVQNTNVDDCDNSTSCCYFNGSSNNCSQGLAVTVDSQESDNLGSVIINVLLCFMLLVGVFGNTLTLVAIRTSPRLWTKSNTLVACLAAIDLLVSGPFGAINVSVRLFIGSFNFDVCKYFVFAAVIFPIEKMPYYASSAIVISIAVDRYVAIVHCLRYDVLITPFKIRVIIVLSWVYALVFCSFPLLWMVRVNPTSCNYLYSPTLNIAIDLFNHCFLSVVMFVIYTRLFFITIKQQRKIHAQSIAMQPSRSNEHEPTAQDAAGSESEKKNRKRWMKEWRALRMTTALAVTYAVCPVPYLVASAYATSTGNNMSDAEFYVTSTIAALNTTFEWLVYAITSKEYMRAYKRIMTCGAKSTAAENSVTL